MRVTSGVHTLQVVRVQRSATHAFMMKLIYKDLNKLNTEKVGVYPCSLHCMHIHTQREI